MTHPAHLAQLLQAAHLGPAPGTFEEDQAIDAIDADRDDELAARDLERQRRAWRRSVAKSVRERGA
jgi:hypothetical protein